MTELENVNQLVLMYAGKRFSYRPSAYKAHNILAVLDYNSHMDCEDLINKDGTTR